jgi:hypothetical protein
MVRIRKQAYQKTTATFAYQFNNCLIKYDATTTNQNSSHRCHHYSAIIPNKNPKFYNINLNKLNIDETSGGFAKGLVYSIQISLETHELHLLI